MFSNSNDLSRTNVSEMKLDELSYEQQIAMYAILTKNIRKQSVNKWQELAQQLKQCYNAIPKDEKPCQEVHDSLRDLMNHCEFEPQAVKAVRTPTITRLRTEEKMVRIKQFVELNGVATRKDITDHLELTEPCIMKPLEILLADGILEQTTPRTLTRHGRQPKYAYQLTKN
jgi:DNA repair ATPase RecN